jgi:hypothetical protein
LSVISAAPISIAARDGRSRIGLWDKLILRMEDCMQCRPVRDRAAVKHTNAGEKRPPASSFPTWQWKNRNGVGDRDEAAS